MKSIVYARVACVSQHQPNKNLVWQTAKCTETLKRKGLFNLQTKTYQEVHSGNQASEKLRSIIEEMKPGDCIVVTEPSRISRNYAVYTAFRSKINRQGCQIIFSEEIPFQTPLASIASSELKSNN